jgi:predicted GIY-YIG superfamily endonuclease
MPSRKGKKTRASLDDGPPTLVYALQARDANHSYIGATNNFQRRLSEHNGLVKGRGARYTRRQGTPDIAHPNWSPIFKVHGFPLRRQALQFEKLFHGGFGRRSFINVPTKRANPFGTSSAARRAWYLYWALQKERFSRQKTILTKKLVLRIEWSRADFYKVAKRLSDWGPARVKHVMEKI